MKVVVDFEDALIDSDFGTTVDGICLICTRCGHNVEVMGTGIGSAKYGAVLLSEECPNGESNYYEVDHWTG